MVVRANDALKGKSVKAKLAGSSVLAVGLASDEAHNGSGRMDEWKRRRLFEVGADVLVPDFREVPALLELIFGT